MAGTDSHAVHAIAGTRPEAVKIAPIVQVMRQSGQRLVVIDTGQQPGRVAEALAPFGLEPDISLGLARIDGGLNELVALTVAGVDAHLATHSPSAVLVQGDTTTALAAALAARMRGIKVVHLEAGLRTYDKERPFPEETNRVLIADLADLHLAPTARAARALAREGHAGDHVVVTGNTIVDALHVLAPAATARRHPAAAGMGPGQQLMVATTHRREAWDGGVRAVAEAIRTLVAARPNLRAVVVTHPNPAIADELGVVLAGVPRVQLLQPQPYEQMLALLSCADLIVTDSGGIQEEAPSLGVPVVVARELTERPEGVAAGWAALAGHDTAVIVQAAGRFLDAPGRDRPRPENPYGDGKAALRSVAGINWLLSGGDRPGDWQPGVCR